MMRRKPLINGIRLSLPQELLIYFVMIAEVRHFFISLVTEISLASRSLLSGQIESGAGPKRHALGMRRFNQNNCVVVQAIGRYY